MYSSDRFLNNVILFALKENVTDIHFVPCDTSTHVYLRVHGQRHIYKTLLLPHYKALLNHLKFQAQMDVGETRLPQDGVVTLNVEDTKLDLRLSTLPVRQEESLAIRILPHNDILPLNKLLLFNYQVTRLKSLIQKPSGIVLLTGPTGSGKTTLLYSLIETLLKEQSYQTITLEDPIEKDLNHFVQVQINEKSGMTYQTGLKAALRHDPDILMVGEIRDHKTAAFVFHAAYTGHLVFSTLHAKDAKGTIHRLIEMGIKPVDLTQNLLAICATELISINHKEHPRAAIIEFLTGASLLQYCESQHTSLASDVTFGQLKRKAYAYGFV
ncbi:competence protein ComG [Halolactibacillus alkaliphilus]|uniref:Competence protein ComG n=1 Tax=Halolactibacillus alkaliphilus TaxID=442899 RepID=A0A511X2Q9_9BACI|nr:competence type IV pilus ATPase ComGA [Halolactibacillus alkaliphilus]GEN57250.1 competence protein ComG [Halolactibacillus alkaliphilus]GGN68896.1 competence protein ComG [Halolactibacillus alkaliphilus]SFO73294.1 competence protein ComGA [Halolactibacillus alkaliphilus]